MVCHRSSQVFSQPGDGGLVHVRKFDHSPIVGISYRLLHRGCQVSPMAIYEVQLYQAHIHINLKPETHSTGVKKTGANAAYRVGGEVQTSYFRRRGNARLPSTKQGIFSPKPLSYTSNSTYVRIGEIANELPY